MGANPYAFDGARKANADALNAVTADIHARLLAQEALAPEVEAAKDSLVAIGLQRLNTELLPAIRTEQARVERGVLIAGSSTAAALVVGATLNLVVDEADRLSFSPSAFVMLTRRSTTHDLATLHTANWDSGTGIYTGAVVGVIGDPGPWADWQLGAQAGSTLAQRTYLAEGRGSAKSATDAAAAARADRLLTDADAAQTAGDRAAADASATAAAASAGQAGRLAAGLNFTAASATSVVPALGQLSFALTAATAKGFVPTGFYAVLSAGAAGTALTGQFVSYDPVAAVLTLLVFSFTGSAARADWQILPTPPPFVPSGIDGGYAGDPVPPSGATPFTTSGATTYAGVDGGYA